jgi:electron transfer flavoprotein beta subunit
MLRAKKESITIMNRESLALQESDVGLQGSPTRVIKVFTPPQRACGEIIQGTDPEKAAEFILENLKKEKLI